MTKKYPKYKNSNISWIGDVPSHWEFEKAKNIFTRVQRQVEEGDEVITCFRDGQVTLRKNRRTEGFTESLKEIGYQHIKKGDLVIHQMDAFAGSIGVSDSDGKATPVYICCVEKELGTCNNLYFAFLMRRMASSGYIKSLYRGIRERSSDFRYDTFCAQPLLLPPLPEQTAIVNFLDDKCSRIDTYITNKEKQIALLKEYKQSFIADAVTKGINKNVKFKDSGISWIGDIPEHWEVGKLNRLLKLVSIKNKGDQQLLSVTREQGVIIRNKESKEENHNFIPDDLSNYKYVQIGDFVINKMKSWQGSYGVSSYDGIVSPAYFVCKLNFENKEYFSIAIRCKAYVPFFSQYSKGIRVDQWDLDPSSLKNIPFLVPPLNEQQAIVEHINTKVSSIDTMVDKLQKQIDLIKEYKQSLIADVVTGKICVTD